MLPGRSFVVLRFTLGSDPLSVTFYEGCVLGLDYLFFHGDVQSFLNLVDFSFQFVFYLQIPTYFLLSLNHLLQRNIIFSLESFRTKASSLTEEMFANSEK